MYGLKQDWALAPKKRHFVLEDYEGAVPRWCPGCGDLAVLTAVQRLARDEQLIPEKTAVISGIGCSSRFPHYMKTYGFHGLHGRCLPVACGVRSRRPDLHVFAITGDGDCTAIGAGHWIHAIRYNMKMTVLLFDNNIYGLTKMQTSPTTPKDHFSNTHPRGALLSPLRPLGVTVGITNASFVAQTIDWNPAHVYATIKRAFHHEGLSFVRILQRCPHYMSTNWDPLQQNPERLSLLKHPKGIVIDEPVARVFKNHVDHDPTDLGAAHYMADTLDTVPIGLLYLNENAERYDLNAAAGLGMSAEDKLEALNRELDRFET
ncbi:MAG: 2-oxoglutarate oxidoreductase [Deltaproteobacteria bacterium CG2_30_63_29]|nr:MAG: 2-oxoglutarate oxidoreductase [Deltaproteobacteria bacterium CG2_30_63_29]PJB39369.1 MAG: 2-oxoglutarate oxidoreductase [Deltaproteobacteria bacterium CG_4_9_14_3_um_filter_63_12]